MSPMFEINDVPQVFGVESFEHALFNAGLDWLVLVCDTRLLLPGALCWGGIRDNLRLKAGVDDIIISNDL